MKVKLSDAFELQMGKTPPRNDRECWGEGHKWISISDIGSTGKYIDATKEEITDAGVSKSGIKVVPKGTVIMSFKLSIGKTAITAEDMYTNEAIMAFINKGRYEINTDYLYHMCKGIDWLAGTNKAVLGLTLNKATMSEKEIVIPSIAEQLHVVSVLDKMDELIALRKEQLAKLDQLVKSRFIELFGDPVDNPKGWKKDKAENYIDLISGFPFDSSKYTESGVNICGGLIIMPQRIEWGDCKHWCSIDGYEEYALNENDIVIALDRPWISEGFKIAMVEAEHLPALLIQRTARIRAIGLNQFYLMYCFLLGGFDKHCNVTGSLVPHISAKDIRSFAIMLPPIDLQEQFAAFVEQTDKSKLAIQQSLDKLELLKNSLMQDYFG